MFVHFKSALLTCEEKSVYLNRHGSITLVVVASPLIDIKNSSPIPDLICVTKFISDYAKVSFKFSVENTRFVASLPAEVSSSDVDKVKWAGMVCLVFVLDLERDSRNLSANMLEDLPLIPQEMVAVDHYVVAQHHLWVLWLRLADC